MSDPLSPQRFLNLVARVRHVQKTYEKGDRSVSGKKKQLEKELDEELTKYINPNEIKQQTLFS
jgi:hypothetical protein